MNSPQTTEAALVMPATGQSFPLGRELVTIGRKTDQTIVLADDLKVSRHHAAISWQDGRYLLQDMGSANGTFLNEQRLIEPQPLHHGDLIRVGDTTLAVHLPEAGPDATAVTTAPELDETFVKGSVLDLDATALQEPIPVGVANPYVGPRTFTQQESDRFFGREREARELLSLVISERLVLFYAQSGAGKSSLINARLVPQLRAAGFPVLPIGRVGGELPAGVTDVANIFVFNLLLSLDESDGDPGRFTGMTLTDFLTRLTSLDGHHYYYDDEVDDSGGDHELYQESPYILIIDQFEEIVTSQPGRWQDREDFFRQLDQAMTDDPYLWVVLTLREDYVAPLDPYIHLLSGKLRARFYMQRMGYEAALEAVKRPARRYGRPFGSGVAESLVDNLRQIRVYGAQSPGQGETQLGQFVEPVQLQVVCYQLWENLKDQPAGRITQQDLQELGDVDTALAQFYEQAISDVVSQTGVSEIDLRNWFETQLITEAGTRGTVYRGKTETGGIPNQAVELLVNRFMLRSEVRTGGTWYELVHDRFVPPILQADQAWRLQQPLLQMAQAWANSGRTIERLLEGQPLRAALATKWQGLGPLVEEFLEASQAAQEIKDRAEAAEKEAQRQRELKQAQALAEAERLRAEEQARSTARLRWLVTVLAVIFLAAVTFAIFAFYQQQQAEKERAAALAAQQTAEARSAAADANAAQVQAILTQQANQPAAELPGAPPEVGATATAIALQIHADILESTRSAEAALAALPTATDTPAPAATPTPSGYTPPPPAGGPTDTPTATPTSTPNRIVTIQAIEVQLTQVRTEQTAVAQQLVIQATAEPDSLGCAVEIQGKLRQYYRDDLGCAAQAEAIGGFFAEQPFENGFMFWSQIFDIFVVTIKDPASDNRGAWQVTASSELGNIPTDSPVTPCSPDDMPPPERGQVSPIRGFGAVWCRFSEIRRNIGYATAPEYGVTEDLLQKFEAGYIIKANDDSVYILYGGEKRGEYERRNR